MKLQVMVLGAVAFAVSAPVIALGTALLAVEASAQSPQPPAQLPETPPAQSANGIIMQAIQPSATKVETNNTSGLLWIYDTNTKKLMLCTSSVDRNFNCTRAVPLNW